jgi:hypothetical protein
VPLPRVKIRPSSRFNARTLVRVAFGFGEQFARTREIASSFVGMSLGGVQERADAEGLVLRVVTLALTGPTEFSLSADLRPNRVTVFLRDGIVLKTESG